MTSDDVQMTIFGSFDGLASAVGVVAAAAVTASSEVFTIAMALALSAMISMAAGEWLSDTGLVNRGRRAAVMGVATLCGSILPALPFLFMHGASAALLAAGLTIAAGAVIAEVRPGARLPSYAKTMSVLAIASGLAIGCAVLSQAVG